MKYVRMTAKRPMVGALIGLMVVLLIGWSVVIPTLQDVLTTANFTGVLKTISDNSILLLGVVLLVAVAGVLGTRK